MLLIYQNFLAENVILSWRAKQASEKLKILYRDASQK